MRDSNNHYLSTRRGPGGEDVVKIVPFGWNRAKTFCCACCEHVKPSSEKNKRNGKIICNDCRYQLDNLYT
jgi:hypothetical protein